MVLNPIKSSEWWLSNMSAHSRPPNTVCATCLSQNRQMFTLPLQHIKLVSMFYKDLTLTESDQICWECKHFVIKMVNFKDRAIKAQSTLAAMINKKQISFGSLSALKVCNGIYLDITNTTPNMPEDPLLIERVKSEPDLDGPSNECNMENSNTESLTQESHIVNTPIGILLVKDETLLENETHASVVQGSAPQIHESVPQIHESVPQIHESVPQIHKYVTQKHKYVPQIHDSVRQIHEFVPRIHEPVPQIHDSVPQIHESVPQIHESVPQIYESVPQIHESVPQKRAGVWESMLNQECVPRVENPGVWSEVGFADATLMSLLNRKSVAYPPPINVPQRKLPMIEVPTLILPKNPTTKIDAEKPDACENPDTSGPSFTEERLTEEERRKWWESKKENAFYANSIDVFRCEKCVEPFFTRRTFLGHQKVHTEIYGKHICDICKLRFHTEDALATHKNTHYRLLKCTRCAHKWDSPNSMRRHCETEHSIPVTAWNCDICTKELTVYGRYLNHLRCHGREYCNQCDKWLFINQMKVHQLTHKDERLFKCSECEKSFKTQLNLTTHIARVHSPEDAMMYCAQCDKQFKNMYSYSYHLKNASGHVPKERLMYKCTQCDRQFRIRSQLARHVEAAHSHERRHECQVCREMFKSAKSRRRHVRLVHENYIAPKDKICDYCGKAFRAKKTLSDHINTHTGRRPFVCKLCGADFCHQSALYLHARYKHRIPKKSGRTLKKVAGDKVEA